MSDPRAEIAEVCRALDPFMAQRGFARDAAQSGAGSGGPFAQVVYSRGPQSLVIWLRYDLLSARYRHGATELDHALYMSLLGARESKRFPCSGDILSQLESLMGDLRERCAGFLQPGSDEILRLAAEHQRDPGRFRGLRGL